MKMNYASLAGLDPRWLHDLGQGIDQGPDEFRASMNQRDGRGVCQKSRHNRTQPRHKDVRR